jgi:N-methylhydantoinase A
MADVTHDYMRSKLMPLEDAQPADVNEMFERLASEAMEELGRDGFVQERIRIERSLDLRYAGQGYEIAVPCRAQPFDGGALKELRAAFDQQHQRMFGHMAPRETVEIVSYRVRGIGVVPPVHLPVFKPAGMRLADAQRTRRGVRFDGNDVDCPVYDRERLDVGLSFTGPAIVEQLDCTTVVCPGQIAHVDEWKNLIVTSCSSAQ